MVGWAGGIGSGSSFSFQVQVERFRRAAGRVQLRESTCAPKKISTVALQSIVLVSIWSGSFHK